MFVIVSRFFLRKRFTGMAIWPFVFVRTAQMKRDTVFMNHEKIHLRQQLELLIVPFFIWYIIEFLVHWIRYKNRYDAYRSISFEKEAYENEKDLDYLKKRSFLAFIKYV
ncbi:hypothetical protein [Ulvibacter antarcticus]|uniref:Peptidase M56 domain-containing protein n=1 Tax=Ulvibacter antarcticus TaxID=442714 RepID=A0A3L9YAD3_9FLAO|nr:hypothetical protein [Ulvibacter antarcticus]RMA57661.1 hypothetical protein BXY75_2465 [Ulvibacter antarcticus]